MSIFLPISSEFTKRSPMLGKASAKSFGLRKYNMVALQEKPLWWCTGNYWIAFFKPKKIPISPDKSWVQCEWPAAAEVMHFPEFFGISLLSLRMCVCVFENCWRQEAERLLSWTLVCISLYFFLLQNKKLFSHQCCCHTYFSLQALCHNFPKICPEKSKLSFTKA